MAAPTCDPSPWEAKAGDTLKVAFSCTVSLRPVCDLSYVSSSLNRGRGWTRKDGHTRHAKPHNAWHKDAHSNTDPCTAQSSQPLLEERQDVTDSVVSRCLCVKLDSSVEGLGVEALGED